MLRLITRLLSFPLRGENPKSSSSTTTGDMTSLVYNQFICNKMRYKQSRILQPSPDESIYRHDSAEPNDEESMSSMNSSAAPTCQLYQHKRPDAHYTLRSKKDGTISSCETGYWIVSGSDFVVLELSRDG